MASPTVRDATFDVLRSRGLTTFFGNPGSTEVPLLADLPDDLRFVLALHEGSAVGMATGWAIGRDEPAVVILHTTAGLGHAVGALATARGNRAPLVVLVGQQDRRHLRLEPFLAGRLHGLAGEYPVHTDHPLRPEDVPSAVLHALHESVTHHGPVLVVVPMDYWSAPAGESYELAAAARVLRTPSSSSQAVAELATLLASARSPALVVGAGTDDHDSWAALEGLAERIVCPVWQEFYGARAGFRQDHPLFAGYLPAERSRLRETLSPYDLVLVLGAPVFRQFGYEPGPLVNEGTRLALVSDDAAEVHRSPVDLAILASPRDVCTALANQVPARQAPSPNPFERPPSPDPPPPGKPLRAGHVFAALAERLPADAVVFEETPSNRPEFHFRIPARRPLGVVSAAMGGLGFALPAATGMRMARPDRPVFAVTGEGSALFSIQALWSAAYYEVGVLFLVLSNGGYAVLDRITERHGGTGPWPPISVDMAGLAESLGCRAHRISDHGELLSALDDAVSGLPARAEPLLLEVVVAADPVFEP
jgi:benzoylformate decarboxylase